MNTSCLETKQAATAGKQLFHIRTWIQQGFCHHPFL